MGRAINLKQCWPRCRVPYSIIKLWNINAKSIFGVSTRVRTNWSHAPDPTSGAHFTNGYFLFTPMMSTRTQSGHKFRMSRRIQNMTRLELYFACGSIMYLLFVKWVEDPPQPFLFPQTLLGAFVVGVMKRWYPFSHFLLQDLDRDHYRCRYFVKSSP